MGTAVDTMQHLIHLAPLLLLLLPPSAVHGYSGGAPVSRCETMMPGHYGTQPRDPDTSPFNITVASAEILISESLNVSLRSEQEEYFKGFILKAVTILDGKTVGTFKILDVLEDDEDIKNTSAAKYLQCAGPKSAVTHSNGEGKTGLDLQWTPDTEYMGEVRMVATVVKGYSTFWVNVMSEPVKVLK